MDTLRGNFDSSDISDDSRDYDVSDEESGRDVPPPSIGQDERRMQVRAYNFWAGMLDDRNYPSIEELDPASNEDFGPFGVLLDFSVGIEDPAVQFLGDELAKECGTDDEIRKLSDVPPRSLLSRITDHYMQILANQAPIGFEAEFVNQRGNTVLYRGILLPFSSDDETIDFIYGVINWKEMAEAAEADELLLEIDQALGATDAEEEAVDADADTDAGADPAPIIDIPLADGPGSEDEAIADVEEPVFEASADDFGFAAGDIEEEDENVEPIGFAEGTPIDASSGLPTPAFGDYDLGEEDDEEEDEANYDFASLTDHIKAPVKKALSLELDPEEAEAEYEVGYEDASFGGDLGSGSASDPAIPTEYVPEPASEPAEAPEEAFYAGGDDDNAQEPFDLTEEAASDDIESSDDAAEDVVDEPLDLAGFAPLEEPASEIAEQVEEPLDLFEVAEDEIAAKPEPEPEPEPAIEPVAAEEVAPEEPAEASELDEDARLYDYLASARELAQTARSKEDRSRQALYAAVGRAYDFSLAAQEAPAEYEELVAENGLAVQDRAPMTPVVKLVFGADYDKTRLTEYAAVLSHAHRVGVERGALSAFLSEAEGGLKGVVKAERQIRREEAGKEVDPVDAVRKALAKKLRELEAMTLGEIDAEGAEFSIAMLHRTENGEVVVLGEVDDDIALIERVGRKLVA